MSEVMHMKFKNIFLKYVFRYFVGFLMIFLCSILVAKLASKSIEKYILDQVQLKTQEGIRAIRDNFNRMDLITQVISGNEAFTTLAYQKGQLPKNNVVKVKNANKLYNEITVTTNYSPYMFTLFAHNDLYLSSNQSSFSFPKYYNQFLKIEAKEKIYTDSQQLRDFLFQQQNMGKKITGLKSIEYVYSGKNIKLAFPLLYLSQARSISNPLYISCFIIDKNYIIDQILMPEIKDHAFLQINDLKNQEPLLEYGNAIGNVKFASQNQLDRPDYYTLVSREGDLEWEIIIGLPHSFIDQQLQPVQSLLHLYLLVGMLGVIILTLYYSFYHYHKLKQVFFSLSNYEGDLIKGNKIDEYKLLVSRITNLKNMEKQYRQDAESLVRQNEAILLEHLIISGIKTKAERQVFEKCFSQPPEFFCLALVRVEEKIFGNYEKLTLDMIDFFRTNYPEKFANVYSGVTDELFLFEINSKSRSDVSEIANLFERLIGQLTPKYNLIFHVGISSIGTDIANINKCYDQAKQMVQAQYRYANENVIKVYDISLNSLYDHPVNLEAMNKLYTLLMCDQASQALELVNKIKKYYERRPYIYQVQKEQIYYTIRNVFYSVWLNLNCPDKFDQVIPGFDAESKSFDQFTQAINYLSTFISQNKKSQNDDLKLKIIDYLTRNYHNPELSAYLVSREMGISEKYLFHFIKEQTGETFANYLLNIRIEKAKEFLNTQKWSNEKIAELVGFGSINTFYRNFKAKIGVSPKVYQEKNLINSNDLID